MRSDREASARGKRPSGTLRALLCGAVAVACASEPQTIHLLDVADAGTSAGRCSSDSDCSTNLPRCDVDTHRCVECLSASECAAGMSCSTKTHRCSSRCESASDCSGIGRDVCGLDGSCVQCASDYDCGSTQGTPRCNLRSGVCVECVLPSDCNPKPCFDDCLTCVNNQCIWKT